MGKLRPGPVFGAIDGLFRDGATAGLTDQELLERFATRRDSTGELAFAALVARHGPMVLSTCRRMLHDPADADDAFQGTFLVLVRRAGSIRFGNSLGPWLYGTSIRVARRVRSAACRRRTVAPDDPAIAAMAERGSSGPPQLDLRLAIDEALARLPTSYRTAVALCHQEGMTHEEAAERLGCPVGTVRSRLARGRALLRERLARSGLAPRGWASSRTPWSDRDVTPTLVSPHLIENTARAAARLAAGRPLAETVSARLTEIVAGVTQTMWIPRIAAGASLLVAAGFAAWGAAGLAAPEAPAPSPLPAPAAAPAPAPDPGPAPDPSPRSVAAADPQAQAPARSAQSQPGRRRDLETRSGRELPADFPAFVVATEPKIGEVDVDPSLRAIRVTFSKPMRDKSWSWTQGNVYAFPEINGDPRYEPDRRTCVLTVKLEPGKTYVVGVNGPRFHGFQDPQGQPALPYSLAFRTRAAR